MFTLTLIIIGGVVLASSLSKVFSFLTFHFLPFGNSLKRYQREPRAWALVTGASAGIGFGHVQELATREFGVIILGHKEGEVNEAIVQVKAGVQGAAVEKIILDATKASYLDIKSALASFMHLPITILVNNVSVQTSIPLFSHFESYTAANISASIAANNRFLCDITHILYPVLKQNGPSLILNISSGAYLFGLPWLSVYSATKAFTECLSKAISREAKVLGDPIDSIAILPGDVRTQMNIYGFKPGSPTGREFAKMVLDRVGRSVSRGYMSISPFWRHDIELSLGKILPERLVVPFAILDIANRKKIEEQARKSK